MSTPGRGMEGGRVGAASGMCRNGAAEWVDTGRTRLAAGSGWEWVGNRLETGWKRAGNGGKQAGNGLEMGWKREDWVWAGMGACVSALS